MSFIFITVQLVILVPFFNAATIHAAVIFRPPRNFNQLVVPIPEVSTTSTTTTTLLPEPQIDVVKFVTKRAVDPEPEPNENNVNRDDFDDAAAAGDVDGCFITGCVPHSYPRKAHGCGTGYIYRSHKQCEDGHEGYMYECCPGGPDPDSFRSLLPIDLNDAGADTDTDANTQNQDEDTNSNQLTSDDDGGGSSEYWNLYKMKDVMRKALCMFGKVSEMLC